MSRLNDQVIIAYYDLNNEPRHYRFDFKGLKAGSDARWARWYEYDRQIEALKGQGCDVHVWDLHNWVRYREPFLNRKIR